MTNHLISNQILFLLNQSVCALFSFNSKRLFLTMLTNVIIHILLAAANLAFEVHS